MKTIIRLAILSAFMVMPFMADAQQEYERIENPHWLSHFLGKTIEEIDTLKDMHFNSSLFDWGWLKECAPTWMSGSADCPAYHDEDNGEGKYHLFFRKDSDAPVSKAILNEIIYDKPKEVWKVKKTINPEWYKHLLGKQLKDVAKELECDSLKWMDINSLGVNRHVSTYVLLDGDTLRQYGFYYETPAGKSVPESILTEIIRRHNITQSLYNEFTGATARMLQSLPTESNTTPSEEVWLKFWEVKIKNDIKKDLKESK